MPEVNGRDRHIYGSNRMPMRIAVHWFGSGAPARFAPRSTAGRYLWKRVKSSSTRNTLGPAAQVEIGAGISREAWGAGWWIPRADSVLYFPAPHNWVRLHWVVLKFYDGDPVMPVNYLASGLISGARALFLWASGSYDAAKPCQACAHGIHGQCQCRIASKRPHSTPSRPARRSLRSRSLRRLDLRHSN